MLLATRIGQRETFEVFGIVEVCIEVTAESCARDEDLALDGGAICGAAVAVQFVVIVAGFAGEGVVDAVAALGGDAVEPATVVLVSAVVLEVSLVLVPVVSSVVVLGVVVEDERSVSAWRQAESRRHGRRRAGCIELLVLEAIKAASV
jgi:hypothetical protein